jgi:uncharacterized damage-inducible protein DinB
MIDSNQLSRAIGSEAAKELESAIKKIVNCVDQLSEAQIWSRENESRNSIANLMLHMAGNLRQWIISGVGGAKDTRDRQSEFDQRTPLPKSQLLSSLQKTVAEAATAMANVTADVLLRVRHVQRGDVSALEAILHSVAHFRGHTQEIIHMTRDLLGDSYRFEGMR